MSRTTGKVNTKTPSNERWSSLVVNLFCTVVGAVVGGLILYMLTDGDAPRIQQSQTSGGNIVRSPQIVKAQRHGISTEIGGDREVEMQLDFFQGFSEFSEDFEAAYAEAFSSAPMPTVSISFQACADLVKKKRRLDDYVDGLECVIRGLKREVAEWEETNAGVSK